MGNHVIICVSGKPAISHRQSHFVSQVQKEVVGRLDVVLVFEMVDLFLIGAHPHLQLSLSSVRLVLHSFKAISVTETQNLKM